MNNLTEQTIKHWKQLRGMTYDFLDVITDKDLKIKLPFKESQTLGYQFLCMCGAQESNISLIKKGIWKGFSCSLDKVETVDIKAIKKHMQAADKILIKTLTTVDLLQIFEDDSSPLQNYMILAEHEAHHQGQIINFIYACDLPIPKSWAEKWALKKQT